VNLGRDFTPERRVRGSFASKGSIAPEFSGLMSPQYETFSVGG
jgi:hypothetical protein